MGSKSDEPHARKIAEILTKFNVPVEIYVASAHKVPELVLSIIEDFNKNNDNICYITIAGKSNGLSGLTSANSIHPVIACPPFKDESDYLVNIHSSTMMPSDTPSMTIIEPQNAAMAAMKILALSDKGLRKEIVKHMNKIKEAF